MLKSTVGEGPSVSFLGHNITRGLPLGPKVASVSWDYPSSLFSRSVSLLCLWQVPGPGSYDVSETASTATSAPRPVIGSGLRFTERLNVRTMFSFLRVFTLAEFI